MRKTNNKSITALTLGILSLVFPLIGFIFAIIGIYISRKSIIEIDHTNEAGKGLAIAGKICSIVGISLNLLAVLLFTLVVIFQSMK